MAHSHLTYSAACRIASQCQGAQKRVDRKIQNEVSYQVTYLQIANFSMNKKSQERWKNSN